MIRAIHSLLFRPAALATGVLALAASPVCAASTAAPAAGNSFAGELFAIMLPLVLIIAGLVFLLRVVRRRYGLTTGEAPLSIVQILPVGPRERLVLVKSNTGRTFAIGVGAQTVTYITEFESGKPESGPPSDPSPVSATPDGPTIDPHR